MDIKIKLNEVSAKYQEKIKNLQNAQQMVQQLTTECINLEGQIQILKELQSNESTN